jgi:hypothetical protein
MALHHNPRIVTNGLVLYLDSYSIKGFTKFGTSGTNNNYRSIINLINNSDEYTLINTSKLDDSYYTLYGLAYVESSQTPASRQGVTSGFDNITDNKIYTAGRGLNYYVFDENTETWVSNSYFNGNAVDGHCYDNYASDEYISESNLLISDCNSIKSSYPNATHIIIGSHAASRYTEEIKTLFMNLGAPLLVDDWTTSGGWQEFILVGKPDLKVGNAYGWVYHNVSSVVANLNILLPITKGVPLDFNGSSDFMDCGQVLSAANTLPFTFEAWVKSTAGSGTWRTIIGTHGSYAQICISSGNLIYMGQNGGGGWWLNSGVTAVIDTWYHVVGVYSGTQATIYVNSVLKNGPDTYSYSNAHGVSMVGSYHSSGGERFNGKIANIKIYNKTLTQSEITQNFNALKGRFGH